ncbi:hypothetical protein PybrP1_009522 [[Pythium] brassicae (nom. inval.)]|nr:hypothetical protein PybrP1_009522 [[Pythium] brassicae (nom. inval.)]
MRDDDADAEPETTARPKRTTSFVARLANKNPARYDLATRIAMERENTKYWARVLLLFPLAPVAVALSTVTVGGVVINAATDKCNSSLMMLSYVQIWFFAYCWMGPAPIKSLRAVRVFYVLYGLACFLWWGVYGTLQAVAATNSGFESCLSTSPTLYIMAQYEVAVFWLLLLVFVGFVVNERTAKLREEKMQQWARRGTKFKPKPNTDANAENQAARVDVLADAAEKARVAEEQQRAKLQQEQDHLYGDGDESDPEVDAALRDDHADEEKGADEGDDLDEDDEEEEELLLGLEGQSAPSQLDKSHQD